MDPPTHTHPHPLEDLTFPLRFHHPLHKQFLRHYFAIRLHFLRQDSPILVTPFLSFVTTLSKPLSLGSTFCPMSMVLTPEMPSSIP
uniref:Putative ovule protein n=1 Tax=Solanum chacoense TaxID=4108 RepID=A0A0V0HB23_SOLCH